MKLAHISDLHIGKNLKGYSLTEDQAYILRQVADLLDQHRPDALLIAGDIYDKSVPSGDAFTLLDRFLKELNDLPFDMPVFMIAGNHDSPERLHFASSFLERHHIYISTMPPQSQSEYLKKVTLEDDYGKLNVYLLPYTKPSDGKNLISKDEENVPNRSTQNTIRLILQRESIDWKERNILVSHQFYQGGGHITQVCDSELASFQVGGLEVVDSSIVSQFDYVALGHIHGAQSVGYPHVRYSGTPLKYSVSEASHKKSMTLVTIREKGSPIEIEEVPFIPYRDVRVEKGTLKQVLGRITEEQADDYISVILTDEEEPYRPKEQLSYRLQHLLELRFENARIQSFYETKELPQQELKPQEAFARFFQQMQGRIMNEEEQAVMDRIFERVWKEEEQ